MKRILLLALLPIYVAVAQDNVQHQKDSLRNLIGVTEGEARLSAYRSLTNIYFGEATGDEKKMDTLVVLYREYGAEAGRQGNKTLQGLAMLNTVSAYMNRTDYQKVLELAPGSIDFMAKNEVWVHYYPLYRLLVQAYMWTGDYDKAIAETQQMYDEAKKRGHENGKGIALYTLGIVYNTMSRYEEEEKYVREAIEILKNMDDMLYIATSAYDRLCRLLVRAGRYDEALLVAQEYEKANYRYEEFAKAKMPSTWIGLWRIYMNLYSATEEYDKAEEYCDKLEGVAIVQYQVSINRAKIYHSRKQYDRALEMADKALELSAGNPDAINASKALKLMILCSKRGVNDIHEMFVEVVARRDSIRDIELNTRLDELRTVYEVDKITLEKERIRNYLLFSFGGCLLLVALLGIYIFYNRLIKKKNRGLYNQIKEQDALMESLKLMAQQYEELEQKQMEQQIEVPELSQKLRGDLQQRKLVSRLDEYLNNERKYSDAEINFDNIITMLATNRNYFFDAVKTVTGMTPAEFVRDMQLKKAKNMLNINFELTIETIADECGFNSRATFYRLFRERYHISPAVYRKMAKEKS